ncbi:LPS export ABC transporter permease LptG [Aestuariirhabdus litorea]|uniref:LPS export ABC transporter permease LptG n=1 Tax=Aestuariirhabdus litorea TaxID=2528527 RepID=A0A3P3VRF3_9GAMM|nr:LPS export ABC transporter permease LptG [Aestuariirhabdus litorea]RRJ85325.1 LPS export ABC transporter permease LptG [Aestuariirhabdus litorea]RWW98547.1 LPS export ABC transporter permease LptG [Endozoicomonadaceae bacterium GTF-13]
MRLLDAYIGRTVFVAILMVLVLLLGLDFVLGMVAELRRLKLDYQVPEMLIYLLMKMPQRTYDYLPFASLIGCLVGVGSLATHSELVVMRAAGVSLWRIVWAVFKPMLLLVMIGTAIGEYVMPYTEHLADSERALQRAGHQDSILQQAGVWHREGDEFQYFNVVEPNGVLHGVSRFRFDENFRLLESSYAKRAISQGDHWILEDVQVSRLEEQRMVSEHSQTLRWDTGLTTDALNIISVSPEDLSIRGLYAYVNYLERQGLDASEQELEMWKKLMQPLGIIALIVIGVSFVFGPLRSVTMGQRVFIGVLFGFGFKIFQDLLSPASMVFGFSPALAVAAPILLCLLLGWWLLRGAA